MSTEEELKAKIELYKAEYENVFNRLKALRQEMSKESKKTLDAYEARLPQLREQIADKEAVLAKLKSDVESVQATLDAKKDVLDEQYQALEATLKKEYEIKNETANTVLNEAKRLIEEYNSALKKVEEREAAVAVAESDNNDVSNSLTRQRQVLVQEQDNFSNLVHATTEALRQDKVNADADIAKAKEIREQAESVLSEATAKAEAVQAILNRISEAEAKEANAKKSIDDMQKERERLNEVIVKCRVEQKSLNRREEQMVKAEEAISKREANVKALEAKEAGE